MDLKNKKQLGFRVWVNQGHNCWVNPTVSIQSESLYNLTKSRTNQIFISKIFHSEFTITLKADKL